MNLEILKIIYALLKIIMALFTSAIGLRTDLDKEEESSYGKMEQNTKATGNKTWPTGKDD